MAPVVAVGIVVAVALIIAVVTVFGVGWLGRHWSRTRGQATTVFALQMAVFGIVQASLQRYDSATGDGRWDGPSASGTPWAAADAKARPQALKHLETVEDGRLRELALRLLDGTSGLLEVADPAEGARLRAEVATLHGQFRLRCVEVVRGLNLRQLGRRRRR